MYRITHWYCPNFGLLDGYQNDHLSPQFFFLWDLWHTMMLDYRPFFSHIQCLGAVHGFWSFYYGWKGPCLGVFPILQYKRPQGEEGFFLGISNLGWTVSYTGCREAGWIQKARRRRSGNWLDSNADALIFVMFQIHKKGSFRPFLGLRQTAWQPYTRLSKIDALHINQSY